MSVAAIGKVVDPIELQKILWPHVRFYSKQRDVIYSVVNNDETIVHAANMMGKDFVCGFLTLWAFLTRTPCRIVTTSVDNTQLEGVLWGEIRRFIQTSVHPLEHTNGGPLYVNHLHLRQIVQGKMCGISYCLGRVAAKGEGMLGHHVADVGDGVPRTFFFADEASGVDDISRERAETWAKRLVSIGNPYQCTNYFYKAVKAGDVEAPKSPSKPNAPTRYFRKIIHISAEDSPNVRLGLVQRNNGLEPSGEMLLPGVLSYPEYVKRRATWSAMRQRIGLDGQFWEGSDSLMYPSEWLGRAEQIARDLRGKVRRARALGVDSAEGGDSTVWCVVDEFGIIELISKKTPNTAVIVNETLALIRKHGLIPEKVIFDRGGGGKEHADQLRAKGYPVQTVAFGEPILATVRGKQARKKELEDLREGKTVYKNRRAQMYHYLRLLLDPCPVEERPDGFALFRDVVGFGIPQEFHELMQELGPIPIVYGEEGRLELPPKRRKTGQKVNPDQKTLEELIGRSPDNADALVMAIYVMTTRPKRKVKMGGMW